MAIERLSRFQLFGEKIEQDDPPVMAMHHYKFNAADEDVEALGLALRRS